MVAVRERKHGTSSANGRLSTSHGLQNGEGKNAKRTRIKLWRLKIAVQRWLSKTPLPWVAMSAVILVLVRCFVVRQSNGLPLFPSRINSRLYDFVPESTWPFTLKDHPEQFEIMLHPGDNKTEIPVPSFWSTPIHRNVLMPRSLAMKIGTCAEPDEHGQKIRGDSCPLDQRTIFVSIASYRDFQCRETVENLLKRASHPERIRVGVVDQIVHGMDVECDAPIESCQKDPEQALCKFKDQVDVFELEAKLSLGPTFARHLGHRLYRGEYYAMQTDAHITFVQDWDKDIINQLESTKNEMAVLSTYLSDVKGAVDKNGRSLMESRPIMCNTRFAGDKTTPRYLQHDQQPESSPRIQGSPQLQPWWAAGFSFSRGHFAVNVPYDCFQQMIFQGEEMSISIRGFTVGYDFYAPERSVCFHHYNRVSPQIKYYDENEQQYSPQMYPNAMKRVVGIVRQNPKDDSSWDHRDEEIYGLGGVRTPEKFYETFGIHVANLTTEMHMCKWVDAETNSMHTQFTPHLREDGMGINYDEISYRFRDPLAQRNDDGAGVDNDEAEGADEADKKGENDEGESEDDTASDAAANEEA